MINKRKVRKKVILWQIFAVALIILLIASSSFSFSIQFADSIHKIQFKSNFNNAKGKINKERLSDIHTDNTYPENKRYLKQITFIKEDKLSLLDDFAYLLFVPNSIFRDSQGTLYVSPILYGTSSSEKYFIEDWTLYLNRWPGQTYINLVGTFDDSAKNDIASMFNEEQIFVYDSKNIFELSKDIAIRNWKYSNTAVLAPIDLSNSENIQEGLFSGTFYNVTWDNYIEEEYIYGGWWHGESSLDYLYESPHPYDNNQYLIYDIHRSHAGAMRVHFDRIDVEQGFDYVYVYNEDWELIASYTGHFTDVWTPYIPGSTIHIVLDSDSSITDWGFGIDEINYYDAIELNKDNPQSEYSFYVGNDVGYIIPYIYTNETYNSQDTLAIYLEDPQGNIVDYSFAPSYARDWCDYDIGYDDMLLWLNNQSGIYKIRFELKDISDDLTIAVFAKIELYKATQRFTIEVPENATELHAWLDMDNDDFYYYMRIGLIDPEGNWIFGNIYDTESFNDHYINVKYPAAGKWTIIVYCNPSDYLMNKTVSFKVNYLIKTSKLNNKIIETASNAAVLASLLNSPLLFIERDNIPDSIMNALDALDVNEVYLVDPYSLTSSNIMNTLLEKGKDVTGIFSMQDLISTIRANSDKRDVIIALSENGLFAPATLLATYHSSPVLILNLNDLGKKVMNLNEATWGRLWYSEYLEFSYEVKEFKYPQFYWMTKISNSFFEWINSYGLAAASTDYAVIIAPQEEIPPLLERAILGGTYPGRIPADTASEASGIINRIIAYDAIIHNNAGKNKIMESLIAYHVGWWIIDNFGVNYTVDDYQMTSTAMYDMEFHIGEDEIISSLNEGVLVWYYADHGGQGYNYWNYMPWGPGVLSVAYNDTAWRTYESGGSPDSPDADNDGIVNPWDKILREIWGTEFDLRLDNLHSTVAVFMACLLGSSQVPRIMLNHGAVAAFANIRTLYFGYGYVTAEILKELYQGKSLGEAYQNAVLKVSYNYYTGSVSDHIGYDDSVLSYYSVIRYPMYGGLSVQYVLFGDPSLKIYIPGDTEPYPQSIESLDIEGHAINNVERAIKIDILSPTQGEVIKGVYYISWSISTTYTKIKAVTLIIDNASYDITGTSTYKWDTSSLIDGKHTIKLIASDILGNIYTNETWIIVDNTLPTIEINGPNEYYIHGNIFFEVNISD
ncbi:MAG: hypothetical protein J7L07_12500, partial [Candidatus Odinarchaeota archaeon]|nr:hypothetical protein [Candidatus Odinarchaeota archaeon]